MGHTDLPLSDRGRTDIAALLASAPEPPDFVLSSDLRRASASAAVLADHWGTEVRADPRLREVNFGEWENRTWDELAQRDGARLERWMRDWTQRRPPGGESFLDVAARVSGWVADRRAEGWESQGAIVVVAHAGSIRALLCELLDVPVARAFAFAVDHAHVTGLDLGPAMGNLVFSNQPTLTPAQARGR